MKKFLFILILLLVPVCQLLAAEDFYHFKNAAQQQRFQSLTTELRCLVCQNQNLAESNAPLAADLRTQVYQQILLDHSDTDIVNYLVARYGDFIRYRPPLNTATAGLWFGPALLLLSGLAYLIYYLQKNRKQGV